MAAIVAVGACAGFLARFHHKMDLEQWTVGGRGFGLILVWLLMAGEIFTTFTFLGASGWSYSKGAPVLYILGYAPLACVVSFFILPGIWRMGQQHKLQTQADFFQARYGSTYLSAAAALVGVVCLLPYVQIQLTGLGLIVETASFGQINRTEAMIVASVLVAGFVLVSGVRGVAWVSIIKDFLLLFAAFFLGFAVPRIYFGGIGPMFAELVRTRPSHLVMPGSTSDLGHSWYITTVLLVACAFYMWPQYIAAAYTARSGRILQRNAMLMPLYTITMPLIFFVGLTALLVIPDLKNPDFALLAIVRKTFPAWFLGLIGGAGALTAMVPAAVQLLTGAMLYTKNLFRPLFAPRMTDEGIVRVARIMVFVLTAGALMLSIYSSLSIASLLLLGYAGVAQLFPGVVLGLFSKRVTAQGVFAGLVVGIAIAVALISSGNDPYRGVNAGFLALVANFGVTAAVSLSGRVEAADPSRLPPQVVPDSVDS
jgi:solute:Na+ symporter, SSS family